MPFSDNLVWPEKAPDAIQGYAMNLTQGELDPGDTVLKASVSVSPCGAEEDLIVAAPTDVIPVYISNGILSVWFQRGVPGRTYLVRAVLETANKATLSILVSLPIAHVFASFPPPEPVSTEFTVPVTWHP